MAVDSKAFQNPILDTGSFTTAAAAVDVTETLGYSPSMVIVWTNTGGTNPDVHFAHVADTTNSILLTGSTGVTTLIAVATGVDITATGFIVRSERQTNDGTNYWMALR